MTPPPPAPDRVDGLSRVLGWAFLLAMAVVLGRVVLLQAAPGETLRAHLPDRTSTRVAEARRGDILDRKGRVLATSEMGYRLFIDPSRVEEPFGELVRAIAGITGDDLDTVARRVVERVSASREREASGLGPLRFAVVSGMLDDAQLASARDASVAGLHLEARPVRSVSAAPSLAPIVGKVGFTHEGLVGLERDREFRLAPAPGQLTYMRDASGRGMWVEARDYKPATPGASVRLSIDAGLQRIAVEELARGVEEFDAQGGRLVMLDPATGEVLAMTQVSREVAGVGAFDAEALRGAIERDEPVRFRVFEAPGARSPEPALARVRCVEDVYEPGSTMKPFVWASLTERGLVDPGEEIDVERGVWRTEFGRVMRDVSPREEITWSDVLVHSSNIGMAKGVLRLPGAALREDLVRFGFGARTGVGLPGEAPGLVTPEARWTVYTQTSVCQGYEIAVTPIQMARAFCAFARGGALAGTLPTLTLSSRVGDPLAGDSAVVRVLPPDVVRAARQAMTRFARQVDARTLRARPDETMRYSFFGKSGTSEIARPDGRGYLTEQHNASFVAAAPADDPRVVILVVLDDPGPEFVRTREHFGSYTALPVVRRVLERTLTSMGVAPAPWPEERDGEGG